MKKIVFGGLATLLASVGLIPTPAVAADGNWWIKDVAVYPGVASYWEKDIRGVPKDPRSDTLISEWNAVDPRGIHLAGNLDETKISYWSWATCYGWDDSPLWKVTATAYIKKTFYVRCTPNLNGQLRPENGDKTLTMFDLANHQMLALGGVNANKIDQVNHTIQGTYWNWRGWDEADADAGLDRAYNPSCSLCLGHRGLDSGVFGFRWGEVATGVSDHLVRILLPWDVITSTGEYYFPYTSSEIRGGSMPQGARLRLTQEAYESPRLSSQVNPYIRTMLDTLYSKGAIVADTGGVTSIALENPANWASLGINNSSLSIVKPTDFEVVELGWRY